MQWAGEIRPSRSHRYSFVTGFALFVAWEYIARGPVADSQRSLRDCADGDHERAHQAKARLG
jgi:hypothetical protein